MVEFETLDSREIKLAKGFIIIAAKKAISESGETEFVSISKGTDKDGSRIFKQTVTIPRDAEVVRELIDALQSVV